MIEDTTPQGNTQWLVEEGLLLEDRVSCDTDGCPRKGTHFTRVRCCQSVMVSCLPCLNEAFKGLLALIQQGNLVTCVRCGETNPATGWLERPKEV